MDSGSWLNNLWPESDHASLTNNCLLYNIRQGLGGMLVDLPTEAEWEFAARAGSSTIYCNGGSTIEDLDRVAWYCGNADGYRHEVGLKEPNNWGLYDVLGNVSEFTLDWGAAKTSDPVWDPQGVKREDSSYSQHIRRGGAWNEPSDKIARYELGSVLSDEYDTTTKDVPVRGFRLCLVMP